MVAIRAATAMMMNTISTTGTTHTYTNGDTPVTETKSVTYVCIYVYIYVDMVKVNSMENVTAIGCNK